MVDLDKKNLFLGLPILHFQVVVLKFVPRFQKKTEIPPKWGGDPLGNQNKLFFFKPFFPQRVLIKKF